MTSFNGVEARRVGGNLKVEGESSSVLAEDIGGAVDIKNSFKNIILRRTSGSITVLGESSSVDVEQVKSLPAGSLIDIKTSFKPIRLALPEATEVEGTARTEFGRITTDFPVFLKDTAGFEGRAVSFSSGEGEVPLKVEKYANIMLSARKGKVWLKLETSADITIKKE